MDSRMMVTMDPSIVDEGWKRLQDRYYRRIELYKMRWGDNVSLNRSTIIGASCGGALAVRRNHEKIIDIGARSMFSQIETYTSSGQLIAQFPEPKDVAKIGWDEAERLVIILRDGLILLMDVFGQLVRRIDRPELKEGVFSAQIWGDGVVVLTQSLQFYCLMHFEDPYLVRLKDPQLQLPPTSWTVIEPQMRGRVGGKPGGVEVLVATSTGTVLRLSVREAVALGARSGPFTAMSVDPAGNLVACHSSTGLIYVTLIDLSTVISTFETRRNDPPKQFIWCGLDSVCCYWEDGTSNLITIIGPSNDCIKYMYDSPVALIGEPDGIRIISDKKCEFLQRVPDDVEAIRRLEGPAAMLCEAYDEYEKPSPRCDELLRKLKDKLRSAVDQVLVAASLEQDLIRQQRLLKAVSLGKTFCDGYPPHDFVRICKTLRVLNQVRDFRYGIPLSFTQYGILTPPVLVERLLGRRLHALAYSICEYLEMNSDPVLVHWACTKIKLSAQMLNDEESYRQLVSQIATKLSSNPGISYSEIARVALEIKKPQLATMLLDNDPRARDQVPLLLDMQQEELAMERAIMSGDTDLIYVVILRLRRVKSPTEFLAFLNRYEVAMSLYIKYCKEQDIEALREVYKFHGRIDQLAYMEVRNSCSTFDFQTRRDRMKAAHDLYKSSPTSSLMSKAADDEFGLLLLQQSLETKTKAQFIGSSLSSTIYRTILLGDEDGAAKIAKNFSVPDKRYWWIKIRALAEVNAWDSLEKFAKDKTSPIGYEPFVEVCMQQRNNAEAAKYVKRIKKIENKIKYMCRLGMWPEAYMTARDAKDGQLLAYIRRDCPDPRINTQIDDQLKQI